MTCLAAITPGCIVPKKYPVNKPFVYSTNINIQGNLPIAEKGDLKISLENQLDDSLRTRLRTIFPGIRQLVRPPVFDTSAALRSVTYMNNLMHAQGYYKSVVTWDSSLTVAGDKQKVSVNFSVIPGKSYKFDSISFNLQDSALQALALSRRNLSLLKKGQPYSVDIIAAEMDRLVELFRNNGYFKFSRDDLIAERDTVFSALINPSLDPFEQLRLLRQARERQEKPVMNVVILLRNPDALAHFRKYYIRNVTIYPDLGLLEDTAAAKFDSVSVSGIHIFNRFGKFKPAFIASKSALRPGQLFRLRNSARTYTNYTELNTFVQVTIDMIEVGDTALLDALIRMYPTKKQDISVTADASYNTADIITAGNLFGVGLNFGLNNRNVAKQAIQSSTNLRTGVEINAGSKFIQTIQTSLSHNISFPRLVAPRWLVGKFINMDSLRSQRTLLNFSGAYTDRKDFYALKSFNVLLGYQATKSRRQRKSHTWFFSPLNIEYVLLTKRDTLIKLIQQVPNLKYSFNDGLVISNILGYNYLQTNPDGSKKNEIRIGIEQSGGLTGLIKKLDQQSNLYRFVKIDGDFKHYINYKKSAFVFRLYGGVGIPYGRTAEGTREQQLPFFKAFYAGGPYSMRAWQVRQLGIGSSRYFDTASEAKGVDRFGDIQLEGNVEYRFNLGTLFGVKLKSALFTDIGNIWYRNNDIDPKYKGADFNLSKLFTDIAVGAGTSLRFDFDYFLIRFDWAYKIKDPAYAQENYGWFHDLQLLKGQFQLGINYPF